MAKKFVKISLASKMRLLLGAAFLVIIAAALVVPWYFMELLAEQGVQQPGAELTRLGQNEFYQQHAEKQVKAADSLRLVAALHNIGSGTAGRQGPFLISLAAATPKGLDGPRHAAIKEFRQNPEQDMQLVKVDDNQGVTVYRCIRALRAEPMCLRCHGATQSAALQFQGGQLVGLIDVTLPGTAASGPLVWWTRASLVIGALLASALAFVLLTVLTQRIILRPVRKLQAVADKVAEGDLAVRSHVKTGDELQHLGDSFNDMLQAITDQHDKLRSANRALDLKLGELAEANVTLFKANQVKNEFLANVSHELRTPLNSIIGFAELVGDSPDERLGRYGQNINTSAKALLAMINDILDLARIEAGKAQVRFDQVNITDTCRTLEALMKPLADKKQLDFGAELADDVPLIVTDGGKVQQILYNLLSNAIKFTPSGGQVRLSTRREALTRDGQANDEIWISISDTGPGIAEADQQHIFEKFHRLDPSLTRESSGTGLGLAISKELTSLIGARLVLKSSPGQGAVFSLALPLAPKTN